MRIIYIQVQKHQPCQHACQSVNAAYREQADEIGGSRTALYNKLNRMEAQVSRVLVQHTAQQLQPVIEQLGGQHQELVPGYRMKILDGNWLAPSERRLAVFQDILSAPLPGKSLVVLDPV